MRYARILAALAVLSLLVPAAAEAKGGGSQPGPFGQGGRGGPSRATGLSRGSFGGGSRSSAPARSSAPSRSSAGGLFGGRSSPAAPSRSSVGTPRRSAPSSGSSDASSPRTGSPRTGLFGTSRGSSSTRSPGSSSGDLFRRQGVPSGGQRAASVPSFRSSPRAPSGTSPARSGTFGTRGDAGTLGAGRTDPPSGTSPRAASVNGGFRGTRGAAAPAADRTGAFGAASRGSAPGFSGAAHPRGGVPAGGSTPAPSAGATWNNGYRVGYQDGWNDRGANHARYGHHGYDHHGYHGWYDDHHWYLSFSFGVNCGPYVGVGYYWPYRSWTLGCDLAFFYPAPVTYCYAPFGFYSTYTPYYVTRYETVRETVPVYVYETRTVYTTEEIAEKARAGETGPAAPPAEDGEVKVADPKPAAGNPATEKLLREASDLFREKKYYDAAVKFRLAAISSPELPGPLFALGQSLIALGQDAYAAKVLRRAVVSHPVLLKETADIAGVYADQAEFDRVLGELEVRAADAPADGDARFLLGYQRYFSGDPRCRADFDGLLAAAPADDAVKTFREAVESRFKAAEDLPEIGK